MASGEHRFLFPHEAAELLGVDTSTIRRWARLGLFPQTSDGLPGSFYTPGRRMLIHREAVEKIIAERPA